VRDWWAVALALATAVGALASRPVPLWAGAGVALVALAAKRPLLLCVGAALLASCLGARSWAGLDDPPVGPLDDVVTLVSDPTPVEAALRVDVRYRHRRLEAWARGEAAASLRPLAAGELVLLRGRVGPVPPEARARLAVRHVAGRLSITHVGAHRSGNLPSSVANGLRRTLTKGAASLPRDERALFTGLVLGDDRDQSPEMADDFRTAGLSHLTAVSGQNVAFVLAAAWPVLRLLKLRARFVAGLAVLALFGVMTRWEPSVLRAETMAAVGLFAWTIGRPASTLRLVALAVAGLLLVDPLLVRSIGFLLSVGACAGIAILAVPLARRIPGPRPLAAALAVTLAAQVGVAPVLAPVFGGVPVAAVPANLLAAAAAGPVMTWGMTAGLVAGVVPARVAAAIHAPTHLLVAWIAGVAHWAADLPLSNLSLWGVALAGALIMACVEPRLRVAAGVALSLLALLPLWVATRPVDGVVLGGGPRLWRAHGATVVVADGSARADDVLAGLRSAGVRRIDAVVMERGSPAARALDPVLDRFPPRTVLSAPGTVARVGPFTVTVHDHGRATVAACPGGVGRCDGHLTRRPPPEGRRPHSAGRRAAHPRR
jgi:competence protein ComEC